MTATIVLADDHPVVMLGLRSLIEKEPDLRIAAEAPDGLSALRAVQRAQPDALIMDLMMPGMNGMDVIREVRRLDCPTAIVVLSMHSDEAYVSEALARGADAYILKDSLAEDTIKAVRAVLAGHRYLSQQLKQCSWTPPAGTRVGRDAALTDREREVLILIARGRANKEIASQLSISVRTVETHRAKIMRKLGIRSHAGLIHYALRQNSLLL